MVVCCLCIDLKSSQVNVNVNVNVKWASVHVHVITCHSRLGKTHIPSPVDRGETHRGRRRQVSFHNDCVGL